MSVAALGDCSNATLSVHGREQSSRKVGTFAKIKNQSKVFLEIYISVPNENVISILENYYG